MLLPHIHLLPRGCGGSLQVQQLMLDPAIEHEFQQLRAQLALRVAETEAAKAAYEGQAFTAVSGAGVAALWQPPKLVSARWGRSVLERAEPDACTAKGLQLQLCVPMQGVLRRNRAVVHLTDCVCCACVSACVGAWCLQESKNGHALLRKVKVLTEENEDLGRQQRESKQAAQVRSCSAGHALQCQQLEPTGSQAMPLLR